MAVAARRCGMRRVSVEPRGENTAALHVGLLQQASAGRCTKRWTESHEAVLTAPVAIYLHELT